VNAEKIPNSVERRSNRSHTGGHVDGDRQRSVPAGGSLRDKIAHWVERELDRSKRAYQSRGVALRALWIVAGVLLVLAGLAMVVLPGPATVLIPMGLVMLGATSKTMRGWLRRAASRLRTKAPGHRERRCDSRPSSDVLGEG
jgi:hypothetical protein